MLVKAVIVTLLIVAVVSDDGLPIPTEECNDEKGDILMAMNKPQNCKYVGNKNHLCGYPDVKRRCCRSCRKHVPCTDEEGGSVSYEGKRRPCANIKEDPAYKKICQKERAMRVCCLQCKPDLVGQPKTQPKPKLMV